MLETEGGLTALNAVMSRSFVISLLFGTLLSGAAQAQFVWPKPDYNKPEPGVYQEDPFIVEYRKKFFAVFRGDVKTFQAAVKEIDAMVEKNPKDARALVWKGNGQTVQAGVLLTQGKLKESLDLLESSRKIMDRAVSLKPADPNIYMMRAATLFIQHQYWKREDLPNKVYEQLRDDCLRFLKFVGPDRIKKVSIHVRGEAYGELGIAYAALGEKGKAIETFETLKRLNPDTDYAKRAAREIDKLKQTK